MADRIARPAGTLVLALAFAASAPAIASTHRHTVHDRAPHHAALAHHGSKTRHGAKPSHHPAAKPVSHRDDAPSGATRVPGGGIKLFCPTRTNPLLIRKATQGAGTTVTLVCR